MRTSGVASESCEKQGDEGRRLCGEDEAIQGSQARPTSLDCFVAVLARNDGTVGTARPNGRVNVDTADDPA